MKRNKSFDEKQPTLFLISTPIGNLNEMNPRALKTIKQMDIIAAEDTRNSGALIRHFGYKKEMFSLREHNESEASEKLIALLKEGKKIAYMSDAGYPGISDPGYILVKKAIENDIAVSVINGSCAFITALVASGLPTDHFYFYGFLSAKESEAKTALLEMENRKETLIFYEAPHRIEKTINLMKDVFGDRPAVIARELTKLNEEYIRGTLNELSALDFDTIKGEIVIVIGGNDKENVVDEKVLKNRLKYFIDKGLSKKDAVEVVSEEYKVNKNIVYKLALSL